MPASRQIGHKHILNTFVERQHTTNSHGFYLKSFTRVEMAKRVTSPKDWVNGFKNDFNSKFTVLKGTWLKIPGPPKLVDLIWKMRM